MRKSRYVSRLAEKVDGWIEGWAGVQTEIQVCQIRRGENKRGHTERETEREGEGGEGGERHTHQDVMVAHAHHVRHTHQDVMVAHAHQVHAHALLQGGAPEVAVHHHIAVALWGCPHELSRCDVLCISHAGSRGVMHQSCRLSRCDASVMQALRGVM